MQLLNGIATTSVCLCNFPDRYFPKIFGPNEDDELDKSETIKHFEVLRAEVNAFLEGQDGLRFTPMSLEEIAMGYVRVANEAMCCPIRALTQVIWDGVWQSNCQCYL